MDDIVTALLCLVMSCAFSMVALFLHVKKIEKMLKRSIKEAKSIKTKSSETKRLWRKCRKLQSGQDRQWIIMLINLLLLGLVLSSVGCGMKRLQRRDMRKVHIPDSIVYPRLKKLIRAHTLASKSFTSASRIAIGIIFYTISIESKNKAKCFEPYRRTQHTSRAKQAHIT